MNKTARVIRIDAARLDPDCYCEVDGADPVEACMTVVDRKMGKAINTGCPTRINRAGGMTGHRYDLCYRH